MSILERRGNWKQFIRRYPINTLLITINIVVFLISIIVGKYEVIGIGGINKTAIDLTGEYERFIYAMFLHWDFMHLLFNTFFGLMIIGATLEDLVGSVRFSIIYFITGLASGYGVYLFSAPDDWTVGASGAIYGVLGILLFMILFKKNLIPINDRILIRNLIVLNVIFSFIIPNISVVGHLSGLLTGFVIAPLLMIKEPDHPILH